MSAPAQLNALRAFEATARHQSFAAAAEELHVSSAAVGQLVRGLETWLGVPLFERVSGGRQRLVASEAALAALPHIQAGFERLGAGLTMLRQSSAHNELKLTVSPAFASKWLLPRMDSFSSRLPDTDLLLDTSRRLVDFVAQRIDIGVRYGSGKWPGLVAEKLMEEVVFPVCSPALLAKLTLKRPHDLLSQTLIHDLTGESGAGYLNWSAWLEHAGVPKPKAGRGLRINNSAAVLQAAMDGQGIALARSVMASDDIASGRLVRLFPHLRMLSPLSYYAVYRQEAASKPAMRQFLKWLKDEAKKERSA